MLVCLLHMSCAKFITGFLDHECRQFELNLMQHMKRALAGSTGKGMGGRGGAKQMLTELCVPLYVSCELCHHSSNPSSLLVFATLSAQHIANTSQAYSSLYADAGKWQWRTLDNARATSNLWHHVLN